MDEIDDDTKGGFRRIELLTGPGRRPVVGGGQGAGYCSDAGGCDASAGFGAMEQWAN
jgi:hypothetical protein